jgi:hypothetical protein
MLGLNLNLECGKCNGYEDESQPLHAAARSSTVYPNEREVKCADSAIWVPYLSFFFPFFF